MGSSDSTRRCQGITASGKRCEKLVAGSHTHCFSHDPTKAQRRSEAASKAAKAKHAETCAEILEIRENLKSISAGVLKGTITTAKGSVVAQLIGVLLRTFDEQRKQIEHDELRKEVDELKARFATRTLENDSEFGSGYWAR